MFKQKLMTAVLAITFIACNDNDGIIETTTYYPVELSLTFPEREQTFQYPGWNENKQVATFRTDTRNADKLLLVQSEGQTYTGTSEDKIDENTELAFLYPASASTASGSDTLTQILYINSQDGTLKGLATLDYTWGTYTYDTSEEDYAPTSTLKPLTSFCKFQFTENGRPIERISQVIITSPTDSLHVATLLNLSDGNMTNQRRGSMVIRNTQGMDSEIHVAFFPMETALHFTLSTLDGQSYEASISEAINLKAGDTAVFPDIACSALEAARIGDYYYNDATWSTSLDECKECVGIIYALDDSDGNIDRSLSKSAHGRIVALQDCASQATWCTTDGDVENTENQTILQDTMYVGSLPYLNGTQDSFFSDNALEHLNGIRLNPSTGQISAWYQEGALGDFDGQENTRQINHSTGTYTAASSCQQYSKGLYGWYLPAEGELALLWAIHRTGIICKETHDKFVDFEEFGYWTSTEYDESEAWYINFFSGMTTKNSKNSMYNVRPVIRF